MKLQTRKLSGRVAFSLYLHHKKLRIAKILKINDGTTLSEVRDTIET